MLDNGGATSATIPALRTGRSPGHLPRVLVVDSHPIVRHGVRALLDAEVDLRVDAVPPRIGVRLARRVSPDLIVTDVEFDETQPRVDLVRALHTSCTTARLLVFTGCRDREVMLHALRLGVHGYMRKDASTAELVRAVRAVLDGQSVFDAGTCTPPLPEQPIVTVPSPAGSEWVGLLTLREMEVVRLIALGLSNREVGEKLSITEATVKFHVRNLRDKLEVRRRTEIVFVAVRAGLV